MISEGSRRGLKNESDDTLIDEYQLSGDLQYVTELYQRYAVMIYGVCLKYLETEQARDTCMQLYEVLIQKIGLQTIKNFRGWIYTVVKNECLMQRRKLSREENALLSITFMESHTDMHPSWEQDEAALKHLGICMDTLPEHQQLAVRLFYQEQKCYQAICTETGFNMGQVKSYIQNGRRNLKFCIEQRRENENDR